MERSFNSQKGAVLITFALMLILLVGFSALAMEVGRWYLIKAQLSKAVDAAALAGANNISNPFLPGDKLDLFAKEVGKGNFPTGYAGTPGEGKDGTIVFTTTYDHAARKFSVTGNVSMFPILTGVFGIQKVAINGFGVAQKNDVEIMMVLDKSSSMAGKPISDLKKAALSFLSFFEETEDTDKMGLITFATGVTVDHHLSTNFVSDMTAQISAMSAQTGKRQFTNAEDAIDRSDNQSDGGFTDQTLIPGDQRVQQFLIFFTDGNPNTFRGTFTRNGTAYDAVAYAEGAYGSCTSYICGSDGALCNPITGDSLGSSVLALPTGDGKPNATTNCSLSYRPNTKWHVFSAYPVPGYSVEYCGIPEYILRPTWFRNTARQLAINHAQELKDKGIQIYIIGLGNVDKTFLGPIASGSAFEYYAPTSDELEAIFNAIAKEIKLRLVG